MKTYFILDEWNRSIKIGRSANPQNRLKQLQTGHSSTLRLIHTIDGDHEKTLHSRWRDLRINGEWFQAEGGLLLYLGLHLGIPTHALRPKLSDTLASKRRQRRQGKWEAQKRLMQSRGVTQVERTFTGKITHHRHVNVLLGAYADYKELAGELLIADLVVPFSTIRRSRTSSS